MNRKSAFGAFFFLMLLVCALSPVFAQTFLDPGFTSETVTTFEDYAPIGLTFDHDGRMFIWEKSGIVRIFKDGSLLPTPFVDISSHVNMATDRGLLGLALDPDLDGNGYVYLLYVYEANGGDPNDTSPRTARLTRVTADPANPDVALPGSEVVLLGTIGTPPCDSQPAGSDCIPDDSDSHTIGTIRFGPDGSLFVGNGDGSSYSTVDPDALRAQDLNKYSGKILRINKDGTAPIDNPFYDGTNSIQSKVWALGLRNPYRFALDPVTGEPVIGDVGWDSWEEINRGRGSNFGWPCYEGNAAQPLYMPQFTLCQELTPDEVTFPLYTYSHAPIGSAAILAGTYYTSTVYPAQYTGNLFIGDYARNLISRMVFDSQNNLQDVIPFAINADGPVSIEQGHDGYLYYVSFPTGEIRRILFNGPSAKASATPVNGYSPLDVNFSSDASSDPNDLPLTFAWDFGDGNTSTLPNPEHTYTSPTVVTYTVHLTVTNSNNQSSSDQLSITVGSLPPVVSISAPLDGTNVQIGDTVTYQGSATDPDDGTIPTSSLHWTILLHHNTHVHSYLSTTGSGGSFSVPDFGVGTYGFELILHATDSSGLISSQSVQIHICPTLSLSPSTLADGGVGIAYQQTFAVSGGNAPYSFAVTSGALPSGITLDSVTGELSGTPAVAGSYTFEVTANDSFNCEVTQSYTWIIQPTGCPTITLSPSTLPDGTQGTSYSQSVAGNGGAPPYTYTVSSGALPAGITLNSSNGLLSGIPSATGNSSFSLTATDMNGCSGVQNYSLNINPPACPTITLTPSSLPAGTVGVSYSQSVSGSGGAPPYIYAVATGSLPNGVTLNSSSGSLSGTPTTAGTFPFTISATDSNSCSGNQAYSVMINPPACPTITLSPSTLPDGTEGVSYSQNISGNGGVAPYAFAVISGTLPTGVTLDAGSGVLSGSPTATGAFTFTISATDSNNCSGTQAYTINIAASCLFCDEFNDGILDTNWTYGKPTWTESGGALTDTANGKKSLALASPVFSGCLVCYVETSLTISGGHAGKIWILGWYVDKNNTMELLWKERSNKIYLRQRFNHRIRGKAKASFSIDQNVNYVVRMTYDGTAFDVSVDGNSILNFTPAFPVSAGAIGFQVKSATASFDYIHVN